MDTDNLRHLWQVVSRLSPDNVMSMTSEELTSSLLRYLSQSHSLSLQDQVDIQTYLSQKQVLIRELFGS